MLTALECCLESIVDVFCKYSCKGPPPNKLSKGELKCLLQTELPNLVKHPIDPKELECIFDDLDKNKDQQISFKECLALICTVLLICHEKLQEK